ncbi:MAG TPA: zf-HC2 domain-containing protein [Thermoanaerobaculia bacterium]|nr:zf-HC2 domain-containing protein [Thermoanaerobaculia bacterium]
MDDEKPTLTAALRQLAERERRSLKDHPTPQELASYHAGELPPEAEARLREHLAVCHECSDMLLDLARFSELTPPPGVPELTDQEVEEDWQALRKRMGEGKREGKRTSDNVVPLRPVGQPKRERDYPLWMPIAASLLIGVLGASYGIYERMQPREDPQGSDSVGPYVPEVFDLDATVRGGETVGAGKMSSQRGGLFFLTPAEEHPRYRVEVRQNDKVLWGTEVSGPIDSIPVNITPNFLEPGSYKIQLSGVEQGRAIDSVEYDLEVE